MANTVVISGSNFTVADVGEKNWGQNTTDLLIAIATALPGNSGFLSFVAVASSPISGQSGKTYLVNTASARTINLPAPAINAYLIVKDISGLAESNNITLHRNGTEKIDGVAADHVVAINNAFVFLISDGVDWYVLLEI